MDPSSEVSFRVYKQQLKKAESDAQRGKPKGTLKDETHNAML
jgi:hypothetical protein